MLRTYIIIVCLVPALCARADILIDDFEDVSDWSGLDLDASLSVEGTSSGCWDDHLNQTGISKTFSLVGSSNTLSPDTLTISEFQYGMLPQAFVFIKAADHRSRSFLH